MNYRFKAKIWEYPGEGAWFFITVPKKFTNEIKIVTSDKRRGFGSVRVKANIGKSTWLTSIFPDSKSGSYLLPVKKEVRQKNNLDAGVSTIVNIVLSEV